MWSILGQLSATLHHASRISSSKVILLNVIFWEFSISTKLQLLCISVRRNAFPFHSIVMFELFLRLKIAHQCLQHSPPLHTILALRPIFLLDPWLRQFSSSVIFHALQSTGAFSDIVGVEGISSAIGLSVVVLVLVLPENIVSASIFSEEQNHFPQIGSQSFLVYHTQRERKFAWDSLRPFHSTVQTDELEVVFEDEELVTGVVVVEVGIVELVDQEYGVVLERNFVAKSFTSVSPMSQVIFNNSTVSEKSSLHVYTWLLQLGLR